MPSSSSSRATSEAHSVHDEFELSTSRHGSSLAPFDPADELDSLMQDPVSDDEDLERPLPPQVLNSDSSISQPNRQAGDDTGDSRSGSEGQAQQDLVPGGAALVQQQRAELLRARREATRLKLHPYQIDTLESFVRATPLSRQVSLYAEFFALSNRVDLIVTEAGPYTVSPALQSNIKSYTTAVLLSPQLPRYKGKYPRDRVMTILRHYKLDIPPNIEHDKQIEYAVHQAITDELTQVRARMKKAIIASTKLNTLQSIYELSSDLVKGTQCVVTVQLAARVATLRKVYDEGAGGSYWDTVDARLKLILEKSQGDKTKIHRMVSGYLEKDRQKYGIDSSKAARDGNQTEWQNTLDTLVAQDDRT